MYEDEVPYTSNILKEFKMNPKPIKRVKLDLANFSSLKYIACTTFDLKGRNQIYDRLQCTISVLVRNNSDHIKYAGTFLVTSYITL